MQKMTYLTSINKLRRSISIICLSILVLGCAVPGFGQDAGEEITVNADKLEHDRAANKVTATGNVVIRKGVQVLRADKVTVNTETQEAEAEGNVSMLRVPGEEPWTGAKLNYNFETGDSSIVDMKGASDPFFVESEKAEKRADGIMAARNATVTTCTNAPGHHHYHVTAKEVQIVPEDYIKSKGAVFYFGPVPFFYFPYWKHSLEDDFGFRFYPGYSSRMGAFLLSSYRYRINSVLRGETHLDYRTERGVAVGQDLKWNDPDEYLWNGKMQAYLLDDQKPIDDDEDAATQDIESQRYRFKIEHEHTIGDRDYLMLNADYLSDTDILEDFFEDDYRSESQPDNYIVYTYRADRYAVNLDVHKRLNDFYTDVDKLPELSMDLMRQQIFDSDFYYEGTTAGGFLEMLHEEGSTEDDYSSFRFDTSHTIYRPDRYLGFLNVIPRVGYRATYYSETVDWVETPAFIETVAEDGTTNLESTVTMTRTEAGADMRSLVEFGVETSYKAFKMWEGGVFSPLRHIVEPYGNYTLVPEPGLTPDNIYQFDDVDELGEQHNVRVGVRNKFQTKWNNKSVDLIDLDLYTYYRFTDAENGVDGIDGYYMDVELQPTPHVKIDADAYFDTEESRMEDFNTRMTIYSTNSWAAYVEHRFSQDESNLLYTDLTLYPHRNWNLNVYGRYEFEESRAEEYGGYVQRNLDCMKIRTGFSAMPSYVRSDGTEKDDEWRLLIELWLTAFPEVGFHSKHKN